MLRIFNYANKYEFVWFYLFSFWNYKIFSFYFIVIFLIGIVFMRESERLYVKEILKKKGKIIEIHRNIVVL